MNIDAIDPSAPGWSELRNLFSAYLNPDFDLDYSDWQSAVLAYRGEANVEELREAREKIRIVLDNFFDESDLEAVADRLGLDYGYYPKADGWTYRGWFNEVASLLDE